MTSDRAHRPARVWDAAVAEIGDMSGSRYDPDVIAAMLACVDDLHSIFSKSHNDMEGE